MRAVLPLFLLAPLLACSAPAHHRAEFAEVHMGMEVRIVAFGPEEITRDAIRRAFDRVAELEDVFSSHRPGSEVRRLPLHAGTVATISRDLMEVLQLVGHMYRASDGAFDPTVGVATTRWRDAAETGTAPMPGITPGWDAVVLDSADRQVMFTTDSVMLDLGGIAKGYILDRAAAVLDAVGINAYLLEAGGELVLGNAPPGRGGWSVLVGDTTYTLSNTAVGTSGDASQRLVVDGDAYSHIVHPATGTFLNNLGVVTVTAERGIVADAAATALRVGGPDILPALQREFPSIRVLRMEHGQNVSEPNTLHPPTRVP